MTQTMIRTSRSILAFGLALAFAVPSVGWAQSTLTDANLSHVIIPQSRAFPMRSRPDDPTRSRGVEIETVKARIVIRDRTASTTLDIALRNTENQRSESVLLLPVPDGAVVGRFAFEGSASEPTARVLGAEEARRLYDDIVAKVLDPALLEFAGYDLLRSSVFPVPANGTQRVRLSYEHVLESDGNRVDYILPRSESLDGRRPWQIDVELADRAAISAVYSPSHALATTRRAPGEFSITLDDTAHLVPGPFRLSYLLEGDGVSASVFAYPDPTVGGGYFMLMAGLPASVEELSARIRREVTIVIDRSGSMAGAKMDQVKAAALQVIEGLDDGEAFNIVDYSTTVSTFAAAPVSRDAGSAKDARAYLASIGPGGGTNIHDALLTALRQKPTEGTLPIVLFLTDGLPTIGRTGEVDIREMVEAANTHHRRIFTFGVGHDVNAPLLDRVANVTRGMPTYVLPEEDVELKVARVFKKLYGPVFAAPQLVVTDTGGVVSTRQVHELVPHELPDLFVGDQLILLGQYRGEEPAVLTLTGNFLGAEREFRFPLDPTNASVDHAFVPRLWASRRIAFLIDEIRQGGAAAAQRPSVVGGPILAQPRSQELVDEILRLSTKFGILTEYTAFLATEGTDLGNWEEIRFGCSFNLDQRAVHTRSGAGAISQSMNYWNQRAQATLNYDNSFINDRLDRVDSDGIQQISGLAFFRRGNEWVDSRLVASGGNQEADEVIMIGTPEHSRLLDRFIREGRQGVLSLYGSIKLLVDGKVFLITDGC